LCNFFDRYKLRAVIHHKSSPEPHFTATLISKDNTYYHFDDLIGIKKARTSTDMVEFGIYSQIYEF
jgi:ubiquitin C-terminal hydrolase